jgi:hypothetical protein
MITSGSYYPGTSQPLVSVISAASKNPAVLMGHACLLSPKYACMYIYLRIVVIYVGTGTHCWFRVFENKSAKKNRQIQVFHNPQRTTL